MDDVHAANRQERLMGRALAEARRAAGKTSPNPMVGCVLVDRDGTVRATGHHSGPGCAHAERDALEKVDADTTEWEVYVNLEPCCHHGRTPPCTDALIEADVARVYVATGDPHPRVDGRGIAELREAGIDVEVGVCEAEARRLNRSYFRYVEAGRPWISVKYAMSLDGKIATRTGDSRWITGDVARERVHELRDRYDAIMVGSGTLHSDDPRLTSRIDGGVDPLRVVLDARLELATDANVVNQAGGEAETLVVTAENLDHPERRRRLEERDVEFLEVPVDDDGWLELPELFARLADREVVEVFVEGGGELIGSLFEEGLVDRVYAFVAPKLVGGREAPTPIDGAGVESMSEVASLEDPQIERLGDDLLVVGDVAADVRGGS